ncbi:MAG TPA: ATP-grasp domain-containing protein [Gaiellaceae bacterium]|nr:ATP-grasp domain-containing protein [Gaiellaceae bacterium]
MPTVLFVGAGRNQRRGIARLRELGAHVVAVDRNPDAPGLAEADAGEAVDFADVDAVAEVGRRHGVEGVLTFAADRAVPVVASVAERLGLPGIGSRSAHLATNKIAMRRELAEHGVPQPQFAALRTLAEAHTAARTIEFPAVLKPADSAGQRGIFRVHSDDELAAQLALTLAASPSHEAIVEQFHEGREVNTLLVAREDDIRLVTASDRVRPDGVGFGVALAHVYPSAFFGDVLAEIERVAVAAVRAIGLRNGIAYPQLLVSDDAVRVVEIAARIPAGQMDEVPRFGVGIDLLEIALLQSLGEPVPDELVTPRFQQPLAIRFLTASPGPLPTGVVQSVGPLDKARAFPGVERVDTWLEAGETIRPVQTDGDRRGYVIARGATNIEALERADAAAGLIDVLTVP